MKYLWILGLFALPAVGQIPNPVTYVIGTKVGALPAARSATYQCWGIYDGASSSDCTTGGGSSPVVCWSNGTTWSAVSGGSGSGGSITGFGTLVAYDVYYMPAGGSLATAKADGSINLVTNPAVCVASSTSVCATAGNTVTNGSWSWTVGGVLYVSDATTGLMTQTSPSTSGHYVQQIGIALSATVILIQPGVTQSL